MGDTATYEVPTHITFYERTNTPSEEGDAYYIEFGGYFAIERDLVARDDAPLDAGFRVEFGEAGGPRDVLLHFSEPLAAGELREFERFFGGAFDEGGTQMKVDPERFLRFTRGSLWKDYNELATKLGLPIDEEEEDDFEDEFGFFV